MTAPDRYEDWFQQATGNPPYAYQCALVARTPNVLRVPTGSGKTQALIGSWLFQRRGGMAPRRLVYALPMRSLVEQTASVAHHMRERLEIEPGELPIHVLMGGELPSERDWRLRPESDQILIGTIDMLLSRALNRGYAESRFQWPIDFGLLNNDCRWVFDEVQLMGPARATSAQLDGLRQRLGTALASETVWASATVDRDALVSIDRPDLGTVLELPDEDRSGPLASRLGAVKKLTRLELTDTKPGKDLAEAVATSTLDAHVDGTRTIVVINTVEQAQETYRSLAKLVDEDGPRTVLLHSRYRPADRDAKLEALYEEPSGAGAIVISTQVIEAGVDVSARTLVTQIAPFSSIVQRLGRCNRAGEYPEAAVLWIDTGELDDSPAGRRLAAPYLPTDLTATRRELLELDGESLSPTRLEPIQVPESTDDPTVLRRRDLLDLFDTSPDLSGMDLDISPFIREDDERTVAIFFRDLGDDPRARIEGRAEPLPAREELLQVPRSKQLEDRGCWLADHVSGDWRRTPSRAITPGSTVMLAAADGGYNAATGWDPKHRASKQPVETIDSSTKEHVESIVGDRLSYESASEPQELIDHLRAVADEAAHLADSLDLTHWSDDLTLAGALHDVGKAHAVFQGVIRKAIGTDEAQDKLWAKSGSRGGRYTRPFFRHELASALAVRSLNGKLDIERADLVTYLIAAHHGKVRLSIRPAPGEEAPADAERGSRYALGVVDGDVLPAVQTPIGELPECKLDLALMELGDRASWGYAALSLRDDPALGPFRVGMLEAVLRMADWRASGA